MFYHIIRLLLKIYFFIYLGPIKIIGRKNIPLKNFILVAPHHYLWDAPILATVVTATTFFFMAKKELFNNYFCKKILLALHAFPVNRKDPAIKSLKFPIKELHHGDKSLILFPTGSRFSKELKPGYLLIAYKSGVPLLPAVINHRRWGKTEIKFGPPFYIDSPVNHETVKKLNKKIILSFNELSL